MGTSLTSATHAEVLAVFARAVCGADDAAVSIGELVLRPGQRETVRHTRGAIERFGGALVADDVGSGKTFVALAIAAAYRRPIVVAPASLRSMWQRIAARAQLALPFASVESLGRSRAPPSGHDIVIVDEAHHLRNPSTQRYTAAREMMRGARVLLLSATPVHNTATDLDTLLALFLGANAADLTPDLRARVIVRSTEASTGPRVVTHPPTPIRDAARVIESIRMLPPPIRPVDGGNAPTLLRLALLRAWCSSVGAFAAMLRRATLGSSALIDALRAGRTLTRNDLRALAGNGETQLAFAELFGQPTVDTAAAIATAEAHLVAIDSLRTLAREHDAIDDERASVLMSIVSECRATAVLACTQYAMTVDALWRRLRTRPGVAALTSRGARIASGPMSREDALARFAPVAQGMRPPHERERITLLIATDLVSEGLNLQDAGVLVHLDLPWTSARLAQRVGRIARFGSAFDAVHTHALAPPRAAAAVLGLERRIRAKRELGERLVGGAHRANALLGERAPAAESAAEAHARTISLLRPFRGASEPAASPFACAVHAQMSGWIALCGTRLVAKLGDDAPTTDPGAIAYAIAALTSGKPRDDVPCSAALVDAERWLARERARELTGAHRRNAARVHGRSIAAAVGTVRRIPAHERVAAARTAASDIATLSAGPGNSQGERAIVVALAVFSPHDCTTSCDPV